MAQIVRTELKVGLEVHVELATRTKMFSRAPNVASREFDGAAPNSLLDPVVLGLPVAPLCRDDCPGLCSECGAHLADDPEHHHETSDPRWSALQALAGDAPSERETPDAPHGGAGPDEEVS